MDQDPGILIYESLEEMNAGAYENELTSWLNKEMKIPYFQIDSLSDFQNFSLANQFLKQTEPILFIILFGQSKNTKGLINLVNTIRSSEKDKYTILVSGDHPVIEQMGKGLSLRKVADLQELKLEVMNWISSI